MQHHFRRNVAERFFNDCMADHQPSSMAVIVDFFPAITFDKPEERERYYNAYNRGIRSERITAQELDEAVGDGPKLTILVQAIDPSLPVIETSYDLMPPEDEEQ